MRASYSSGVLNTINLGSRQNDALKIQRAVFMCDSFVLPNGRGILDTRSIGPKAWDDLVAGRTRPVANRILKDIVPGPSNQYPAATGTVGVRRFAVDVPFVHVVQS